MVTFRCYDPSSDGGGGIHGWYDGLCREFQAEIDAALEILALEDNLHGVAEIKPLRGACEGLTEICIDFEVGKTQVHIRILGFDGPSRDGFTLLIGFEKSKHNAIYGPYCESAHQRKQGVMRDGRRSPPCGFP
jgi:hypothetical protein